MTVVSALIVLMVLGALVTGAVIAVVLAVTASRRRHEWAVDTGPIAATAPEGELQDPQYAGSATSTSSGDEAGDIVIAVVGTGITPLNNRAPLTVPRTQHSQRHG